eukprot:gene11349-biopygen6825
MALPWRFLALPWRFRGGRSRAEPVGAPEYCRKYSRLSTSEGERDPKRASQPLRPHDFQSPPASVALPWRFRGASVAGADALRRSLRTTCLRLNAYPPRRERHIIAEPPRSHPHHHTAHLAPPRAALLRTAPHRTTPHNTVPHTLPVAPRASAAVRFAVLEGAVVAGTSRRERRNKDKGGKGRGRPAPPCTCASWPRPLSRHGELEAGLPLNAMAAAIEEHMDAALGPRSREGGNGDALSGNMEQSRRHPRAAAAAAQQPDRCSSCRTAAPEGRRPAALRLAGGPLLSVQPGARGAVRAQVGRVQRTVGVTHARRFAGRHRPAAEDAARAASALVNLCWLRQPDGLHLALGDATSAFTTQLPPPPPCVPPPRRSARHQRSPARRLCLRRPRLAPDEIASARSATSLRAAQPPSHRLRFRHTARLRKTQPLHPAHPPGWGPPPLCTSSVDMGLPGNGRGRRREPHPQRGHRAAWFRALRNVRLLASRAGRMRSLIAVSTCAIGTRGPAPIADHQAGELGRQSVYTAHRALARSAHPTHFAVSTPCVATIARSGHGPAPQRTFRRESPRAPRRAGEFGRRPGAGRWYAAGVPWVNATPAARAQPPWLGAAKRGPRARGITFYTHWADILLRCDAHRSSPTPIAANTTSAYEPRPKRPATPAWLHGTPPPRPPHPPNILGPARRSTPAAPPCPAQGMQYEAPMRCAGPSGSPALSTLPETITFGINERYLQPTLPLAKKPGNPVSGCGQALL